MAKGKNYFSKWRTVLALIVVFLLVLATNLMDNRQFNIVKSALITVYEDRLIAQDLIYRLQQQVERKQLAFSNGDTLFLKNRNMAANDSIAEIVEQYDHTELTQNESKELTKLKKSINELVKQEKMLVTNQADLPTWYQTNALPIYYDIESHLDELSAIQLHEGRRQINESNYAVSTMLLISRLEIFMLILIGIGIQILILYKPKE